MSLSKDKYVMTFETYVSKKTKSPDFQIPPVESVKNIAPSKVNADSDYFPTLTVAI